tara:strand:+ start:628 stop:969 length:342 start_codon:yes stop_codon:yes gene_type:complete
MADANGRPNHIEDVLVHLHDGAWFGWSNSKNKVYENLIIHNGSKSKPTESELTTELAAQQTAFDNDHGRKRQEEYPSINELIVALWENVVEERTASVISLETKRQAVKTKYPK